MTRSRAITITVAVLAGLVGPSIGMAGAASAAPAGSAPAEGEWSDVITDFCDVSGLTVRNEGSSEGWEWLRSEGADGLPYYATHVTDTDEYTNVATGESVTFVNERRGADIHVIDNGDGTLTHVVSGTGNGVLYSEDGEALARQAGVFKYQVVYDHGGTPTDPSDDVKVGRPQILLQAGRYDDLCAAIVAEIG